MCQRVRPQRSVLSEKIHKRWKERGLEEILTLMRTHLCWLWTSLPVLYFHCPPSCSVRFLRSSGISQIFVGRRAALRATTSQGKWECFHLSENCLSLYKMYHSTAVLDTQRDSAPKAMAEFRRSREKALLGFQEGTVYRYSSCAERLFFFCESHYFWRKAQGSLTATRSSCAIISARLIPHPLLQASLKG